MRLLKMVNIKIRCIKARLFQAVIWNGDFQIAFSQRYVNGDLEIAVPYHSLPKTRLSWISFLD